MDLYLEQLEHSPGRYHSDTINREIQNRFYFAVKNTKITFEEATKLIEILVNEGFYSLQGLYFLVGKDILNCGLLSKETHDLLSRFCIKLNSEETEDEGDRLDKMLHSLISELDETLVLEYLKKDSERLKKVILNTSSTKGVKR